MTKQITTSSAADAAICNILEPPTKGVHAGGGIHIVIPADWQTRIANAQDVPGCTYVRIESDGSAYIDDNIQTRAATPAVVNALTAPQQAQVTALNAKLAAAVVVAGAQVSQAEVIAT